MWLTKGLAVIFLAVVVAQDQDEIDDPTGSTDFRCPPGSDGLIPHPEFCDRYFECRGGQLFRKRLCADGLAFDPDKHTDSDPCDYIHNIKGKCKTRPKLQTPQPGDGFCPRQNGVYQSPNEFECEKFYSCLNGVGTLQQCADGLHFDPELGTCVWARQSLRKGCLSSSKRAQQSESTSRKPLLANLFDDEKEGESLPNGFKCPGGKLGIHPALPHPESCRLYYVCLNGVTPNEAGCVAGLVFNKETAKCDDPTNVPGCEDAYETKRTTSTTQRSQLTKNTRKNHSKLSRFIPDIEEDSVDDLAKLLTLLSNPKLKTFLKPEIADVLDSVDKSVNEENEEEARGGPASRQVSLLAPPRLRKRPLQNHHRSEEEDGPVGGHEVEPRARQVSNNRRNIFTSKFIPRIRTTENHEIDVHETPEEPHSEPKNETSIGTVAIEQVPMDSDTTIPSIKRVRITRPTHVRGPNGKPLLKRRKPIDSTNDEAVKETLSKEDFPPKPDEELVKSLLAYSEDPKSDIATETQIEL
jgi:hypothetical protein